MTLNIKKAETYLLAKKLAAMTGDSMTAVVTNALREKLEREQRKQNQMICAEELMNIGEQCADHIKLPASSFKHGDLLYNERGLPK